MLNFIKNFRADEDGAVTVDWVVLTAAIVGLGIAVLASVGGAARTTASSIAGELDFNSIETATSGATAAPTSTP